MERTASNSTQRQGFPEATRSRLRVASILVAGLCMSSSCFNFVAPSLGRSARRAAPLFATMANLADPATRETNYGQPPNLAQYLVDLHDASATFDFCGGMMFQLMLSDELRSHLVKVAEGGDGQQPVLFHAETDRMAKMLGYSRTANADNARIFHGREIRQVPNAAGGMGFVLHLSLANGEDAEGWTAQEIAEYNGWAHDSQRRWRNGQILQSEGFESFGSKFGGKAFTLHHRFYLHLDRRNQLWLSAEDGCEGCPA